MNRLIVRRRSWSHVLTRYFSAARSPTVDDSVFEEFGHLMHGRKNRERRDSVTTEILMDRQKHLERIAQASNVNIDFVKELEMQGLGSKRRNHQVYSPSNGATSNKVLTGAGGFAVHLTSASTRWPIFEHVLPEIAFAGHSNCGKSTLVNAMVGVQPRHGPASISDRAGWTDQICFYQLGKRPPLVVLVDMPGYGHAVATVKMRQRWTKMNRDYLTSRSETILSLCCVLVDCTRGLCEADLTLLRFILKKGIDWRVILTKADLLSVEDLARSIRVVETDIDAMLKTWEEKRESKTIYAEDRLDEGNETIGAHTEPSSSIRRKGRYHSASDGLVIPVSASTGAGVGRLWKELKRCASEDSVPLVSRSGGNHEGVSEGGNIGIVREHIRANLLRQAARFSPK